MLCIYAILRASLLLMTHVVLFTGGDEFSESWIPIGGAHDLDRYQAFVTNCLSACMYVSDLAYACLTFKHRHLPARLTRSHQRSEHRCQMPGPPPFRHTSIQPPIHHVHPAT
ncbi:hypothetical protein F5Y15DRAFT_377127 [Xylariaceae sp. FL0016]|nr:hypothetical protein F5Y15DRAFT_377127 [Xylariaceae sp. FL0016]